MMADCQHSSRYNSPYHLHFHLTQCIYHMSEQSKLMKMEAIPHQNIIQGDRKFTQPILTYLLIVATQYNSIGLINTISL
jgi:hypothetical protein